MRGWVLWALRGTACLVCLCTGSGAGLAQGGDIALLSSRIGNTIDAQERDYFRLFPGFGSYTQADLESIPYGVRVRFTYLTPDSTHVETRLSRDEALAAGWLIDTYESWVRREPRLNEYLRANPGRTISPEQWKNVDREVVVPERLPVGEKVSLVLMNGEPVSGMLMDATSRHIAVWPSQTPVDGRRLSDSARVLPYDSIRSLAFRVRNSFWTGALVGAAGTFVLVQRAMAEHDATAHTTRGGGGDLTGFGPLFSTAGILGGGLIGGLVSAGSHHTAVYDQTQDSGVLARAACALRTRAAFARRVPPEWTRMRGAIGDTADPCQMERTTAEEPQRQPTVRHDGPLQFSWSLVTGIQNYSAVERPSSPYLGLCANMDVTLFRSAPVAVAVRPTLGAGVLYVQAEACARLQLFGILSAGVGVSLFHDGDSFTGRSHTELDNSWGTDFIRERRGIGQQLSLLYSVEITTQTFFIECRYRRMLRPSITAREWNKYWNRELESRVLFPLQFITALELRVGWYL